MKSFKTYKLIFLCFVCLLYSQYNFSVASSSPSVREKAKELVRASYNKLESHQLEPFIKMHAEAKKKEFKKVREESINKMSEMEKIGIPRVREFGKTLGSRTISHHLIKILEKFSKRHLEVFSKDEFPSPKIDDKNISSFERFYKIILDYEKELAQFCKKAKQRERRNLNGILQELQELKRNRNYWCSHEQLKVLTNTLIKTIAKS